MNEAAIEDVLALVFVVLTVGDWVAAVILRRASTVHPGIISLRERAAAAIVLAVGSSLVALLGLNRILGLNLASFPLTTALLAAAIVLMSLPALIWVIVYARDGFR